VKGRSAWWDARAAEVIAAFPLAGTDWVQHSDCVDSGFYSVQNCSAGIVSSDPVVHFFADEPPLSPEEEEQAYAIASAPAQMELF
jgi:hypothetical protein